MFRDNIPCVTLCTWEMEADLYDDDIMSGIIPVLFAEKPEEADEALSRIPPTLRKDLEALQKPFFIPESITKEQAALIIKKPKLGDSDPVWKNRNLDRLFEAPPSNKDMSGETLFISLKYSAFIHFFQLILPIV